MSKEQLSESEKIERFEAAIGRLAQRIEYGELMACTDLIAFLDYIQEGTMTRRKPLPDVDPPESAEAAYERGIVEERARWEARLERLRAAYAQAQKWNDRDKECDRRQERALAVAIDIMSGEGEVTP